MYYTDGNYAKSGDEVFDFYDDFDSGTLDTNKWEVSRYSGDTSNECVIEDGILWLVKKSNWKGCNIKAKGFTIKWYEKKTIEFRFKIDYVCGTINDGDGMALVIDGRDNSIHT